MADFWETQEEVGRLEKKIEKYAAYSGEVDVGAKVDFSPADMVGMTYGDLRNLYDRTQKIIGAQSMQMLAAKGTAEAAPAVSTARAEEVESRIREMSTEAKEMADKMSEEMKKPEAAAPPAQQAEAPAHETIEFETVSADEKKAAMERPAREDDLEREVFAPGAEKAEEEARREEAVHTEKPAAPPHAPPAHAPPAHMPPAHAPEPEDKAEKKVIVAIPPVLRENPAEAADRKYSEMEGKVREVLGEKVNEAELKKKMLELTKQLFKEKSVHRREEIKAEIAVLKNMLAGKSMRDMPTKGKKVTESMAHSQLFDTLLGSQATEMAATKDNKIVAPFREQIEGAKKAFHEKMLEEKDEAKRKHIYESFVFTLTSLGEQVPAVVDKYQDFLVKKHVAEIEKLLGSLDKKETDTMAEVNGRIEKIRTTYPRELMSIKEIVMREVDNAIESAGRDVFREEKGGERGKTEQAEDTVFEINDMDEGTLLFYLHAQDREYYKKYEMKGISKAEAILRAKALMAKEKGLSDSMVRKYFSKPEG